jgi:hypothetical protein
MLAVFRSGQSLVACLFWQLLGAEHILSSAFAAIVLVQQMWPSTMVWLCLVACTPSLKSDFLSELSHSKRACWQQDMISSVVCVIGV